MNKFLIFISKLLVLLAPTSFILANIERYVVFDQILLFTLFTGFLSLVFSFVFYLFRAERGFYFLMSFLSAFSFTPYAYDYVNKDRIIQTVTKHDYSCPKGTAQKESIKFGSGYNIIDSQRSTVSNEEDEKIEPCIGRYKGEPALHYIYRRIKIMAKTFDKNQSTQAIKNYWNLLALKYNQKEKKNILNNPKKLVIFTDINRTIIEPLVDQLLIETKYYKTNMHKNDIEYVQLIDENEIQKNIEKRIIATNEYCHEVLLKKTAKSCSLLFEGKRKYKKNEGYQCENLARNSSNELSASMKSKCKDFVENQYLHLVTLVQNEFEQKTSQIEKLYFLAKKIFGIPVPYMDKYKGEYMKNYGELYTQSDKKQAFKINELIEKTRVIQFKIFLNMNKVGYDEI